MTEHRFLGCGSELGEIEPCAWSASLEGAAAAGIFSVKLASSSFDTCVSSYQISIYLGSGIRTFTSTPSPVYGERDVMVRFRVLDLLWKPVGRMVRFCIVHHPVRGTIFLLSTDTSLAALEILQLYGYRFKIELGFTRLFM